MAKRGLILTLVAGAAIAAHRIVGVGAADGYVVQASAAADKTIGVSDLGAAAAEDRIDVIVDGNPEVQYGGVVARGDLLTADADGKAVVAVAGDRCIGVALVSGVAGDIVGILLSQGKA